MVSEMEAANKNHQVPTNVALNDNPVNVPNNNNSNNQQQQQQSAHSPQDIGVEFVRQYYTVLNRAPDILYRFYSDDSTFIHGSLDKPGESIQYSQGQKQIKSKIMSLNFENCYTKIRQVDSMETIGNGVVIQVIGELSNNRQPMRRFNQTIVLTPQSPNKYYVRNNIFRYQDNIQDDSVDNGNSSNVEKTVLHEEASVVEKTEIETKRIDSVVDVRSVEENKPSPEIATNGEIEKDFNYQTKSNSIAQEIVSKESPAQSSPTKTDSQPVKATDNISENAKNSEEPKQKNDTPQQVSENSENDLITSKTLSRSSPLGCVSNEPKTYAGILGKSSHSGSSAKINMNLDASIIYGVETDPTSSVTTTAAVANNSTVVTNMAGSKPPAFSGTASSNQYRNQSQSRNEYRFQKKNFNRRNDSRESGKNNDSDSGDGAEHYPQSTKKYPDENQLFIGNLMPDFTENVLHKIFERYGKILDIRINRQKMPNAKNRNYGFITFENPEIVDQIIAQKPIYYEKHRYNVEKKQGKNSAGSSGTGGTGGGSNANYDRNRNLNSNRNSQSNNSMMQQSGGINPASNRNHHSHSMQMEAGGNIGVRR
ncbi:hypothetical protein NH340_JMT00277 [Sarcoptes scabiei]|nr:hypothetical protein NH340_JMT00277 [Sarcoptes scabiei]